MSLHRSLVPLLLAACSVFAMDFADFDTTVQVRTYTLQTTDSTFIPLRNTGFTLAYTLNRDLECPYAYVRGDFKIRPDSRWIAQITGDFGDSAYYPQTAVFYYCAYQMYARQFLTPKSKYQLHMGINANGSKDTLYTMVTAKSDDSTFTLAVSARAFGATSLRRQDRAAGGWKPRGAFTADGRRTGPRSRIWIDRTGKKEIDFHAD